MSQAEKNELIRRINAMSEDEMMLALSCFPHDLIVKELSSRLDAMSETISHVRREVS